MNNSNDNLLATLTEPQQMQVYELMGIADIQDGNEAARVLIDANFDLNRAVQRWLDRNLAPNTETLNPSAFVNRNNLLADEIPQVQESELHSQYRRLVERKAREEEEKGVVDVVKHSISSIYSGLWSIWNYIVPVSIRGETWGGEQFLVYFRNHYHNIPNQVQFNSGTFEENAHQANSQNRPLLVFLHVDSPTFHSIPENLFQNRRLVDLMNSKFHPLGLLLNTEESQKIIRYIETRSCPCLAVFRTNLLDEIVLVEFISLTSESTSEQVLNQIENIERNYYVIVSEEDRIKTDVDRSINEQRRRNMQMKSPFFFAENNQFQDDYAQGQNFGTFGDAQQLPAQARNRNQNRIEEARNLRNIQDEEFKEVERAILEQQQKKEREERERREKEEQEELIKIEKYERERKKNEERELKKKNKLNYVPAEPAETEPNAILVIFRSPDGQRIERRFRTTDKAETLYDFIDTQDIKFDDSTVKYDLMQPRPFLCLEDREKSIGEYFEGSNSEVIHIRELTA